MFYKHKTKLNEVEKQKKCFILDICLMQVKFLYKYFNFIQFKFDRKFKKDSITVNTLKKVYKIKKKLVLVVPL